MPLTIWNCVSLIKRRMISVKIGLFFQEIIFRTEFPGCNFLLPSFLTGGKWDFKVANLLLLISDPDIILVLRLVSHSTFHLVIRTKIL